MVRFSLYKDPIGNHERMDWKEEGEQRGGCRSIQAKCGDACSKAGPRAGQNSQKANCAGLTD